MRWRFLAVAVFLLAVAGCARIAAVGPEREPVGQGLSVAGGAGWNRLPAEAFGADRAWTRDGPGLDRLLFVAGRGEGEPLLTHRRERRSLLLRATMTPSEVMELWSTELALRGGRQVTVGGLMPAAFAGRPGFRFQYAFAGADGLVFDGYAAGAMVAGRLYLIAFTATRDHGFAAHWPAVAALLRSARIGPG
ncbi:MAG: hypothetical protein H6844_04110 [Alphaproteobacteria bacterium]|nr:hypothetical protein [Alphaproteobacteria bacterium]